MIHLNDNIHTGLEKLAMSLTSKDVRDIKSYRSRRDLGRSMGTVGSVGLLGSIPVSMLGAHRVGAGLALGGALSALGGMGVSHFAKRKRQKIQMRLQNRVLSQRRTK